MSFTLVPANATSASASTAFDSHRDVCSTDTSVEWATPTDAPKPTPERPEPNSTLDKFGTAAIGFTVHAVANRIGSWGGTAGGAVVCAAVPIVQLFEAGCIVTGRGLGATVAEYAAQAIMGEDINHTRAMSIGLASGILGLSFFDEGVKLGAWEWVQPLAVGAISHNNRR